MEIVITIIFNFLSALTDMFVYFLSIYYYLTIKTIIGSNSQWRRAD